MKPRKINSILFATILAFLSSACTDLKLFAVNAPAKISAEQIREGVSFDSALDLSLDLYFPKNYQGDAPLIIFFYGGSWQDGKKEEYKFVAAPLIERGFVVAIPDYRKYPQVTFPAFIEDSEKAVQWLVGQAEKYNYDASRIILMGHSAGAFNAAMLAYKDIYLKENNKSIQGFIGLSGPYAFTPRAEDIKAVFASPKNNAKIQIPDYVMAGAPPALLLHGDKDKIVGKFNVEKLSTALRDHNVPVTVKYYSDMDHAGTVAEFSWIKNEDSQLLKDIDAFFKKTGLSP